MCRTTTENTEAVFVPIARVTGHVSWSRYCHEGDRRRAELSRVRVTFRVGTPWSISDVSDPQSQNVDLVSHLTVDGFVEVFLPPPFRGSSSPSSMSSEHYVALV